MISDINNLQEGDVVEADIGIVGSGFAGLELAHTLGQQGVKVAVLESGRERFDPETQELARVNSVGKPLRYPHPDSPFTPYLPPIFRGEFRIRQFGGTSNIWTGKWRMFDDIDFAARPWIPYSGWPISRQELMPYYRQIMCDYDLANFDEFAESEQFIHAQKHLAEAGLTLSFHYWQNKAVRLRAKFQAELAQSANVEVILGANATEIVLDDDLAHVSSLRFQSLSGQNFYLKAKRFVLAMGGLEGARLLLASNGQIPAGIGNKSGLVGRLHTDHPKSKRGKLWPGPAMQLLAEWAEIQPRPRFHTSVSLADSVQREHRLLNHAIYLSPIYDYQLDYPQETANQLKQSMRQVNLVQFAAAIGKLLRAPRAVGKLLKRRWYADRTGKIACYGISMYVEQAPNPESSLSLENERDALGMPKLAVNWQLTPYDHESFRRMLDCLVEAFDRAGLGKLDFGNEPFVLDEMVDAAHHIGATRMASTPEEGVVDADCKVFGTENLYIASSSVFPTGHSAAPTMTILALSRRLGEHLLSLTLQTSAAQSPEPALTLSAGQ